MTMHSHCAVCSFSCFSEFNAQQMPNPCRQLFKTQTRRFMTRQKRMYIFLRIKNDDRRPRSTLPLQKSEMSYNNFKPPNI